MSKGKKVILIIPILLFLFVVPQSLLSHCQVPCGIYDDEMRIKMISEHITTIEKAMKQVIELSKESKPNYNQIVRWVFNKEKHAEELSQILTYYFMAQRITPVDADKKETQSYAVYQKKLELLHHLLIYTMKAKQTTDLSIIEKLRTLLEEFKKAYFS
jgi:nickel superoxide dismutase